MKAVLDTSPLCYLILVGQSEILPALFDQIFIPDAVRQELTHPLSPPAVHEWMRGLPGWVSSRIVEVKDSLKLRHLHSGEREAIVLAQELEADRLVIDEKAARKAAADLGLPITGLLGLLEQAAYEDLIELPGVIDRLRETSFHASPALYGNLLRRHEEERRKRV